MTAISAREARANLYRLIDVLEEARVVEVLRLWSHYE